MSILLRLAYDGTDFHGWAVQPPGRDGLAVRTVQGELQSVLGVLCGRSVAIRGASRTDAGVHATGQLVAFERVTSIPCENLVTALNRMLPVDMAVSAAWEETSEGGGTVDPRHGNAGKHYRYRLLLGRLRDPMTARHVWQIERPLEVSRVRDAAAHFVGTHDFAGFRSAMCQARSTVRTIFGIELVEHTPTAGGVLLDIHVRGTAFLHNMVRVMIGTLVEIGHGRGDGARIDEALTTGVRARAGRTAPPTGLTLVEVLWPGAPG